MRIAFRVDSSATIGSGHLLRCLTLANALRNQGHSIVFLMRRLPGALMDLPSKSGFECKLLSAPQSTPELNRSTGFVVDMDGDAGECRSFLRSDETKLVVLDHYTLDDRWVQHVSSVCPFTMVIDDLANRKWGCDILLDQNFVNDYRARYDSLVPSNALKLLGTRFALLRDEFVSARDAAFNEPKNESRQRITCFFGGADAVNETEKAIRGLSMLASRNLDVEVLIGKSNPHISRITKLVAGVPNATLAVQVADVARRCARSTLFVGAGGSSSYERMCVGLPSIVSTVADNQVEATMALARAGAIHYIGSHVNLQPEDYADAVVELLDSSEYCKQLADRGKELVDGLGAQRVAKAVTDFLS